jgi:hypothetical protein
MRHNKGWFKKGADPRRHEFTPEERSRGGKASFDYLLTHKPHVLLGLRKKLRRTTPPRPRPPTDPASA